MVVKPPTERGRKTREKLVVAAAGLFRQKGVRSTSTDDVLAESGCGRSQLYHYFSGKQELVAAVLEYQLDQFLDEQLPALAKADTWTGVRRWLDRLPDAVTGTPGVIAACPIGALAGELAGIDEQMRRALVVAFDRWAGHLAVGLKAMHDRGQLAADADPVRLARTTISAFQGGLLLARTYQDLGLLRDALDAAYAGLRVFAGPAAD